MKTTRARCSKNRNNCMVLFEYRNGTKFIVFDTETTGVKKDLDYIVQIAAKKYEVVDKDIHEIDSLNVFIRPPVMMTDKVISVHKITNEFLEDKPSEEEVFDKVREFFGDKAILAGYNLFFDIGFMEAYYERQEARFNYQFALDVLEMTRDTVYGPGVTSHKQEDLLALYGLNGGLRAHDALDDVEGCARLLRLCYRLYKENPLSPDRAKLDFSFMFFNSAQGRRHEQKGLWLKMRSLTGDKQYIHFSTKDKCWYSSQIDLSRVDMDDLQAKVLSALGIGYEEFSKLTEKRFLELKKERNL